MYTGVELHLVYPLCKISTFLVISLLNNLFVIPPSTLTTDCHSNEPRPKKLDNDLDL